jgi:galactokinase
MTSTLKNNFSIFAQAVKAFQRMFDRQTPPRLFQAPGRVNLIGEHTDYNDGFVLPIAIDRFIVIAARQRQDTQVNIYALDLHQWDHFNIQPEVSTLAGNSWSNYIRGMAWSLMQAGCRIKGFDALMLGNIPVGAGLSSSAALEVAAGYALMKLSDIEPDLKVLASLARRAENDFVGLRCGIMDQFVSCFGRQGHALLLDCRHLNFEALRIPPQTSVIIVDSGVRRNLVNVEYNTRRKECERAARFLGVEALRDVDMESFQIRKSGLLPHLCRRARHVIAENQRTLKSGDFLKSNDLKSFGKMMIASHISLKEDFEASCKELDALVHIATNVDGVYGARLTGAGFGGCVVALVKQDAAQNLIAAIKAEYTTPAGVPANIYVCEAAGGVSEII